MLGRCVVTGGAGFIGSNLSRALLCEGCDVTVVDNLSTGKELNLADMTKDLKFVKGDVRDRDQMERLFRGVEIVFHQAALASVARSVENPWESNDHNINGTLSVLLAARAAGVQRVVYAASSSAYGNTETLPKVESMQAIPLSPYAITKYVGELYCQVFFQVYGLETVALRYFNVFGPRQDPHSEYAAVIPRFIQALQRGDPPVVYGDGEQTRDFTYVENAVAANIRAAMAPTSAAAGKVFNVGCGQRISLNDLLGELQKVMGVAISPVHAPARAGDVRDSLADITLARQNLGYEPRVEFLEGLRRTVAWFVTTAATAAS